jgi:hypothetical protein
MHFGNHFDGIQVVNAWVNADLIQHSDPGIFDVRFEFSHSWRSVARGNNICLAFDRCPDHIGVMRVRNERNNKVAGSNPFIQL